MKKLILLITFLLVFITSCGSSYREIQSSAPMPERKMAEAPAGGAAKNQTSVASKADIEAGMIGAVAGDNNKTPTKVVERKIIKNGELELELDKPAEAYNQISSLASSYGGFVVTSESQQLGVSGVRMTVVVRVPAAKFETALKDIRALGARVLREKVAGQDVTDQYIDLEARLKAKKLLEEQFFDILKKATKVSDMLEVQNSLNQVRTEIEQLEGQLRFLENQASLSTITITLQTPQALIVESKRGLISELKAAISDSIEVAQNIVFGLIRLMGVLVPITILIFLPLYLFVKFLYRRWKRNVMAVPHKE